MILRAREIPSKQVVESLIKDLETTLEKFHWHEFNKSREYSKLVKYYEGLLKEYYPN